MQLGRSASPTPGLGLILEPWSGPANSYRWRGAPVAVRERFVVKFAMGPESGALNIVNADDGSMLLNISAQAAALM